MKKFARYKQLEAEKRGDCFKLGVKSSLLSPNFLNYKLWSLHIENSILVQNFIFFLLLFLISSLREERENGWIPVVERKSWLTLIFSMKNDEFYVNKLHSMREVYVRCSLPLTLLKMVDLNLESFFDFGLIFRLFGAMSSFFKGYKVFFRLFR
jgi:hypothetical protein